ncbi:MAG: hypothetical protein WCP06_09360 [Verrucomicrobiota bacterium]
MVFINDEHPVETCELSIEADVLVNISTAIQSEACNSYQLNVIDGHIADHNRLSVKQRIALLESKLELVLLDKKVPLDVTDKRSGEVFYAANTRITKNTIREIALHFNTLKILPSPFRNTILKAIREAMASAV